MSDHPFEECKSAAAKIAARGNLVFQKWTCDGCGRRVTANKANLWTEKGHCEDCNAITDMTEKGCNYLVVAQLKGSPIPDDMDIMEFIMFGPRKQEH